MKLSMLNLCAIAGVGLALSVSAAAAEPCMKVTLTGTQGGPPLFNGQAGAGTLVQYGDETNGCSAVKLQFDTGRGTNMRLSQMKVPVAEYTTLLETRNEKDSN